MRNDPILEQLKRLGFFFVALAVLCLPAKSQGILPGILDVQKPAAVVGAATNVCAAVATSCTLGATPGQGDIVTVAVTDEVGGHTTLTMTASDGTTSFTVPSTHCSLSDLGSDGGVCVAYLIEPTGSGGKTITVTATVNTGACTCLTYVEDWPVTGGTVAFVSSEAGTGTGTTVNTPTVGAGALMWSYAAPTTSLSGVGGGWTESANGFVEGDGAEHILGGASGTATNFSVPSSTWDDIGMTFK